MPMTPFMGSKKSVLAYPETWADSTAIERFFGWISISMYMFLSNFRTAAVLNLMSEAEKVTLILSAVSKNCALATSYPLKSKSPVCAVIISRDDFIAVQRLISNAKYGNKGFLPELRVIPDGVLKGYIPVNPRWAGFKADDYYAASNSVDSSSPTPPNPDEITAQTGDFDLRGYEVFFLLVHPRSAVRFGVSAIWNLQTIQYCPFWCFDRKWSAYRQFADRYIRTDTYKK